MKRLRIYLKGTVMAILLAIVSGAASSLLSSCGSIHMFGGIEHEYDYDLDGHHRGKHKGHHNKPKKPKKHHHHHHHHDHDDDD